MVLTGIEIFGIIGSAAQLIDFSAKVFKHLDHFVRRSREADAVAKDLQSKVQQLRTCSQTVQRAGRSRLRQAESRELDPEEIEIWKTISRTLNQCERIFQKFEAALEGLVRGKREPAWLSNALLQRKMDKREPRIARLERKIDVYLTTLNVSILSVHFIVHMAHHDEITSMFAAGHFAIMERLDSSLLTGRGQLHRTIETLQVPDDQEEPSGLSTSDIDHTVDIGEDVVPNDGSSDEMSNLTRALDTGASVSVRARSVYDPDAESVRSPIRSPLRSPLPEVADGQSVFSLSTGNLEPLSGIGTGYTSTISFDSGSSKLRPDAIGASVDKTLVDPTPYFDDTTPHEVLEALIERLRTQVEMDYAADHYHQAEENQLEAIAHLEELYIGYGEPFDDFDEMQSQLAKIYFKQDKVKEAQELIHSSLQGRPKPAPLNVIKVPTMVDAGVTPAKAKYYLLLGQIQLKHSRDESEKRSLYLEAAERYAKRALRCSFDARETPDATFVESVTLLIQIYEDKGKLVHADTYRDLYLRRSDDCQNAPVPYQPDLAPAMARQYTPTIGSGTSMDTQLHRNSTAIPSDLIAAIITGQDNNIDDLLQGADLEMRSNGKTAVMYAVETGNERAIRKLHQAGAQLDQALFHAVREGRADMTRLLWKLDANPETREPSGATPLLVAAGSSHASVVRELLEEGVDVNASDREGWSAVHWAAHNGSIEVMRTLLDLQYRVNKDAVCAIGKTALHYLAERDNVAVAAVLLEHEVDTEVEDRAGRTPLYIAVQRRRYKFVKMLVENGVVFDTGALPDTSQEIKNLLAHAERPSLTGARRDSGVSTASRQSRSRMLLRGVGARLRRRGTVIGEGNVDE